MHKPSGGVVVERIEDRHALGIACVCCVFSFAFLVTGTVFMLIHSDQRVVLTTLDVFHDWAGLQGIFRDTVRYDPAFNPPSLDRARFDSNLAVFQDLHSRGLMTDEVFANVSSQFNISTGMRLEVFDMPFAAMVAQLMSVVGGDFAQVSALLSGVTGGDFAQMSALLNQTMGGILAARGSSMGLLYRLLSLSGCAFPDAIPGQTPVSRSKGCLCIGNAYLDFVRASVNMSSNVSLAVREAGAGTVLRCMDRRVTWRTWGGGRWWSLHPLGIMAYCQFVFFLGCLAFILSFRHEFLFSGKTPQQKTWIVRGILSFFAVCFCVVLAWDNWRGNFFLLLGVLVALSGLAFSVTSVLDYAGRSGAGKGPHPLMVCFWINFPLLLPALVVVVVIAGFTRDVVAVGVVGVMAAVLGLVLQRMFWGLWYASVDGMVYQKMRGVDVPLSWKRVSGIDGMGDVIMPLAVASLDLFIGLAVFLTAYRSGGGVYYMSSAAAILGVLGFILVVFGLLLTDFYEDFHQRYSGRVERDEVFGAGQTAVYLVTFGILSAFTVAATLDAQAV